MSGHRLPSGPSLAPISTFRCVTSIKSLEFSLLHPVDALRCTWRNPVLESRFVLSPHVRRRFPKLRCCKFAVLRFRRIVPARGGCMWREQRVEQRRDYGYETYDSGDDAYDAEDGQNIRCQRDPKCDRDGENNDQNQDPRHLSPFG